jgi:hypothetical protein
LKPHQNSNFEQEGEPNETDKRSTESIGVHVRLSSEEAPRRQRSGKYPPEGSV